MATIASRKSASASRKWWELHPHGPAEVKVPKRYPDHHGHPHPQEAAWVKWNSRFTQFVEAFRPGQVLFGFLLALVLTGAGGMRIESYEDFEGLRSSPVASEELHLADRAMFMDAVLEHVKFAHVAEDVDIDRLFDSTVNWMLQSLDPYSEYMGNSRTKNLNAQISRGGYGGFGFEIVKHTADGPCLISQAFEGYGFDAGLRVGDRLLAVDGSSVDGQEMEGVMNLLASAGSDVKLTVQREGVGTFALVLTRQEVKMPAVMVNTELAPGVRYVKLNKFSEHAPFEMVQALADPATLDTSTQGKGLVDTEVKGGGSLAALDWTESPDPLAMRSVPGAVARGDDAVILDLRGNGGGLLQSAVAISSLLLPDGADIVSEQGRIYGDGESAVKYRSHGDPLLPASTRVVVLVDRTTASAAEIVAGAVQDHDRGVIVGDRTFGKGLVQELADFPDGTAQKLTVGRFYTPSGRCIQEEPYVGEVEQPEVFHTAGGRVVRAKGGIAPDVEVTETFDHLEKTLHENGVFADFASEWLRAHPGIKYAEARQALRRPDAYRDFTNYARANLVLPLDLEEPLKYVEWNLVSDRAHRSLSSLRQELRQDELSQFRTRRAEVEEEMRRSILKRLASPSQLQTDYLASDPQVQAALRVARDPKLYATVLRW
jgi:carboxyl-terminal processing protease